MLVHSLFSYKIRECKHAMGITSSLIRYLQCGIIAAGIRDAKIYDFSEQLSDNREKKKSMNKIVWDLWLRKSQRLWGHSGEVSLQADNPAALSLFPRQPILFHCWRQDARSATALLWPNTATLVAAWFTNSEWVWKPDWFHPPWFTPSSLQDADDFKAMLPKVGLSGLTEYYGLR